MKTKLSMAIIVAVLSFLSSCQPSAKKENPALQRAETELNDFRDRLDAISEDDPQFRAKLKQELGRFQQVMDTLANKLGQEGDTANLEIRNAITSIRRQSTELDQKLNTWTGQAHDSIDSLGTEIKKDFRDLEQAVREQRRNNTNTVQ